MFDVGFGEIVLLFIVSLIVLGPERLPVAIRTAGLWLGRLKRSYRNIRADIEREIGADDIRRQLHNEEVMESLKHTEEQVRNIGRNISTPPISTTATDEQR
jgi:sec-independent protein translocase protein TatB